MAKYHGNKGSMTYATSAVAELLEWRITGVEVPMADKTKKGDGVKTFDASGAVDPGVISAVCYLDLEATGQDAWSASVLAGTGAEVAFVVRTDTSKELTFSAVPMSLEMDSPEGDTSISRTTLTAKITGTITDAWV